MLEKHAFLSALLCAAAPAPVRGMQPFEVHLSPTSRTSPHFRRLLRLCSDDTVLWTEPIEASEIVSATAKELHGQILPDSTWAGRSVLSLAGTNPQQCGRAVRIASPTSYCSIGLNCRKTVRHGDQLQKNPFQARDVVESVAEACPDIPVHLLAPVPSDPADIEKEVELLADWIDIVTSTCAVRKVTICADQASATATKGGKSTRKRGSLQTDDVQNPNIQIAEKLKLIFPRLQIFPGGLDSCMEISSQLNLGIFSGVFLSPLPYERPTVIMRAEYEAQRLQNSFSQREEHVVDIDDAVPKDRAGSRLLILPGSETELSESKAVSSPRSLLLPTDAKARKSAKLVFTAGQIDPAIDIFGSPSDNIRQRDQDKSFVPIARKYSEYALDQISIFQSQNIQVDKLWKIHIPKLMQPLSLLADDLEMLSRADSTSPDAVLRGIAAKTRNEFAVVSWPLLLRLGALNTDRKGENVINVRGCQPRIVSSSCPGWKVVRRLLHKYAFDIGRP